MKCQNSKRPYFTAGLAFILLVLVVGSANARPEAEPSAPLGADWDSPPGTHLSTNSTNGANIPQIAYSPDGSKLIAVYSHLVSDQTDRDPYYTQSTDHGETWSTPAPIAVTPGTNSGPVIIAIDGNNVGHVVWIEADGLDFALRHAAQSQWPGSSTPIAAVTGLLADPSIAIAPNGDIHVVWAQGTLTSNPSIRHAFSTDGGTSWTDTGAVATTVPTSLRPSLAIATNSVLHLVWEEQNLNLKHDILYVRGTVSGTSASWSAPALISAGIQEAKEPVIFSNGNRLHVSFVSTTFPEPETQWVYYANCNINCTSAANWSIVDVTGQPLGVNTATPSVISTSISLNLGSPFIVFHGTDPSVNNNEVVWAVSAESGWGATFRHQITDYAARSLYPHLAVFQDKAQLVYVKADGGNFQIYHMSGQLSGGIFLPLVLRTS